MRRKDREMPAEFAWEVVDKCEWATLATVDGEGKPYCVTLSIARKGEYIYFHCAEEGFKIDCLRRSGEVCMTFVGDTRRATKSFTTGYESACIRGMAEEVSDTEEKIEALRLLCLRHTPANMANFDAAVKGSLARTAIWRVKVYEITGKRKVLRSE